MPPPPAARGTQQLPARRPERNAYRSRGGKFVTSALAGRGTPIRAIGATAESAEAEICGRAAVGCGFRHRHAPQLLFVDGA